MRKQYFLVMARLPANANLIIPPGTPEKIMSKHVVGKQGAINALKSARDIHRQYTKSHGNAAAHLVEILDPRDGRMYHPNMFAFVNRLETYY